MSKLEKEIERLKSKPKDYTYEEAKSLLNKLGYIENNKGKTSGSRIAFVNNNNMKIVKLYKIKDILEKLKERGEV